MDTQSSNSVVDLLTPHKPKSGVINVKTFSFNQDLISEDQNVKITFISGSVNYSDNKLLLSSQFKIIVKNTLN